MELSKTIIKKLKYDPDFQEFSEFVYSKIQELENVDYLEGMINQEAGENIKVIIKVKRKLIEILKPIVEYVEPFKITEEMINERRKDFGL